MSALSVVAGNSREAYWSKRLFACLQAFANRDTNAVLQTLAGVEHIESGKHYPENGLGFADRRWRAFYHCHAADSTHAEEHGHFHIFTTGAEQSWAHVAGLSIDNSGQPLQWFAVNRWVTGGPWLERAVLPVRLDRASECEDDTPAGRWLFALLQLYRVPLSTLLARRDQQLHHHTKGRGREEVFEDRDIYCLATQPIELQSMLENHLL